MHIGPSSSDNHQENRDYLLLSDVEDNVGIFDKPLPCFGCGLGWFSFLLGFVFPLMWYYTTILYLGNYYHKDPRERAGLAANAIAALIFTVAILITVAVIVF
ncbi:hypothetical protein CDL12_12738 [Handroanthus impetiginosus]|uniref:60S ribosomal protein L18a-like protein n=1 Tax=Handroanthus impetiginosus TaxID=429701 RepID=A0A2G9HAZ3_9LAMI|nr:hypothetical protein CDL12_12738 [Handroanthus impetiginosus]